MRIMRRASLVALPLVIASSATATFAAGGVFPRLVPLPAPRIAAAAEEFPGGSYVAVRLTDGDPKTEFASHGKGTGTFVEFDFGAPVRIGEAFRPVD